MVSSKLYAEPSGYTSINLMVTSVSFTSDEIYSLELINPLTSVSSSRMAVVYTKISFLASISCWSHAPPFTALPVQQTLPP